MIYQKMFSSVLCLTFIVEVVETLGDIPGDLPHVTIFGCSGDVKILQ